MITFLRSPRTHRLPVATIIVLSVMGGAAVCALVLTVLWRDLPMIWLPLPRGSLSQHFSFWMSGFLSGLTRGGLGVVRWETYTAWVVGLSPDGLRYALYARFIVAGIGAFTSAASLFCMLMRAQGENSPTRGRPLIGGARAVRLLSADAKSECVGSQLGLSIHPDVQISTDRETKHFLVMGASGSGKSQVIWHVLKQALRRGDRVLIFDSKGEFTEELKGFHLIAPWDERSSAWDIAADCLTLPDARELAARLIPDSDKDPLWPNASRQVLVALIVHLQTKNPLEWTFKDLHQLLLQPVATIRQIATIHNPDAVHSLEEGSRTTQSIMINLMAFMAPVSDLARAWPALQQKRFSMRRWIMDPHPRCKIVVLQGSQRYQQLARACCNGLLSVLASVVASPELAPDARRRLWLFLDEFPQLGRVRDIGSLIEMGRSKGLRIVIGTQDIAQLYAVYGRNEADAWTSSMATSIYTRLEGGSTTEWVSRRIGDKEAIEANRSVTHAKSGRQSETEQTHRRTTSTVMPAELKTLLGRRANGVDVLVDGFDRAIYLIRYPFHHPNKRRSAVQEAAWIKPPALPGVVVEPAAQAVGTGTLPLMPHSEGTSNEHPVPDVPADSRSSLQPVATVTQPTARAVGSEAAAPRRFRKRSTSGGTS